MGQAPHDGDEQDGLSANTRALYSRQWSEFESWCHVHGHASLPASGETLAAYLEACLQRGGKVSSMGIALAAISRMHETANLRSPKHTWLGQQVWDYVREQHSTPARQVDAIVVEVLKRMIGALPDSPIGRRDRALLLVGFSGGFRRSELVALNVDDLTFTPFGMFVLVRAQQDRPSRRRCPGSHPVWYRPSHVSGARADHVATKRRDQ